MDHTAPTSRDDEQGAHVVGVTFRTAGTIHEYARGQLPLAHGDQVVVETPRGPALATITPRPTGTGSGDPTRLARVLRKADSADLARDEANRQLQHDARRLCLQLIRDRQLPMKLVAVSEYATYLELRRALPRVGTHVTSLKGDGRVTRHDLLRQTAFVRRHDDAVEVEVTLEDLVEERAD